jgi:hypothetical protein
MVSLDTILDLIGKRRDRVLLYGQTGLSDNQFKAFRKLVLDEFGRNGLETELRQLNHPKGQHATDRTGSDNTGGTRNAP